MENLATTKLATKLQPAAEFLQEKKKKKGKFSLVLDGLDLSFAVSLHGNNEPAGVQDAVVVGAPERAPPAVAPVRGHEHVWVL